MKKYLVAIGASLLLVGCTSAFWSYKATVDGVDGAFKGWVGYYKIATNGASSSELTKLDTESSNVNFAVRDFARAAEIYEAGLNAYDTNGVDKTTLSILQASLIGKGSNVTAIVNSFKTGK